MEGAPEPAEGAAGPAALAPYSLREVARLSGAGEGQLRRWARNGLLPPTVTAAGPGYRFVDVMAARAACALIDQGTPVRTVRQAVAALRAWRPEVAHPLAALKVHVESGRLLVHHEHALMESHTGQLVLALGLGDEPDPPGTMAKTPGERPGPTLAPLASPERPLTEPAAPASPPGAAVHALAVVAPTSADAWYRRAEEGLAAGVDPAVVAERYTRALDLDAEHPGALIGLGNLAHAAGDLAAAQSWYARATHAAPAHPHPWYNLANTLDDLGALDAAAQAYETALALDPDYVDAHFNLALLWEKAGIRGRAAVHWRRVLDLSSDADARSFALQFLEDATDR